MTDLIIGIVLFIIMGAALGYVIKVKKNGKKCIGCPGGCNNTGCSCGCNGIK